MRPGYAYGGAATTPDVAKRGAIDIITFRIFEHLSDALLARAMGTRHRACQLYPEQCTHMPHRLPIRHEG